MDCAHSHVPGAHVLAEVNKGQKERKKHTSTKQKQAEEQVQVPQRGFKEALVSDNEESDDEE